MGIEVVGKNLFFIPKDTPLKTRHGQETERRCANTDCAVLALPHETACACCGTPLVTTGT